MIFGFFLTLQSFTVSVVEQKNLKETIQLVILRDACDCVGYAGLSEMLVTVLVTQGCQRCL